MFACGGVHKHIHTLFQSQRLSSQPLIELTARLWGQLVIFIFLLNFAEVHERLPLVFRKLVRGYVWKFVGIFCPRRSQCQWKLMLTAFDHVLIRSHVLIRHRSTCKCRLCLVNLSMFPISV